MAAPRRPRGETTAAVASLIGAGKGVAEIARTLAISKPTVCYHARKLGIPPDETLKRRYDWVAVQRFYDDGHSITECQRRFGMARKTFYDAVCRGDVVTRPQAMPLEHLLAGRWSRRHLKSRLLRLGLKENRCEECGLTEWRGGPLSMALHHVNGDGADNPLLISGSLMSGAVIFGP